MLRKLWKWLAATFSVVVILLALAVGLFRLLLPLVPEYHERIEAFASDAAGAPVRIAQISARWGLAGPELRFSDARLLTVGGDETLLSAEAGRIVLDLGALLGRREVRAGQVVLDGLELEVARSANGLWRIGGIEMGQGQGSLPVRLALGLRDTRIRFRDELTGAGPWVFDDVELDVAMRDRRLAIEGEMRLPPGLGSEARLSVEASGDPAQFERLDWHAYLRGDDIDLFGWRALMPRGRVVPATGRGDIVLSFSAIGNQPQQVTVDSDLRDVEIARDGKTLREFASVRGRLEYDRVPGGWQLSGRDVVVGATGVRQMNFGIEAVRAQDGGSLLYADVDYARLDDIALFMDWLPDPAWRERLTGLDPRGIARDFSFRMTERSGAVDTFSVRGSFERLGFEPVDGFPGVDGLAGSLRFDRSGGRLQLIPGALELNLPQILGPPLAMRRVAGAVVWRHRPQGWRIISDNISVDHALFAASTGFEVTLDRDAGPLLDLHADLSRMSVSGLRQLLPRPVLPAPVLQWLERALVAGDVPTASIDFNGALQRFPFDEDGSEGGFRAVAELRDARIDYAPGWPEASEIDATVTFHNASVSGGVTRAQLAGNRISSGEIAIADLRRGVLEIHTVADGMLDTLHDFLQASPVAQRAGTVVERLQLAGDGSAQVDLELPLNRKLGRRMELSVIVSTESGRVALPEWPAPLEQVAGSLQFRNGEFRGRNIAATLLEAPVTIDVQPDTLDTGEQSYAATVATVRGAVAGRNMALLHPLAAELLTGSSSYTATVTVPARSAAMPVSMNIETRLEGMAVALPAPLAKRAAESRNLRLDITLPVDAARADIVFGDIANARINWIRGERGWKLDRGGVAFGLAPAELPDGQGLAVTGVVPRFALDGWLALANERGSSAPGEPLLRGLRIEAGVLEAFGQQLRDARFTVDRSEREWLVQIDSELAAGALFVPLRLDDGEIVANLQVLHIGTTESQPADAESQRDPRGMPAIRVQADDFRLGDMQLGRLQAVLEPIPDGIELREFETRSDAFATSGSGAWRIDAQGQRTELQARLTSTDVQTTLQRLGFEGVIDAASADIEMSLNWPGAPGERVREEVNGEVSLRVGAGQIVNVNPGAGRALGLLSFTALPRRLSLDFRDVFDKGFGFDYIEGDFRLDGGNAYTSNLVLEGPAAQVGIAGRTGIAARDYDQTAIVYGNFGAALPVAGAIAGGPVGGAAMLIFSELFKRPLQNMGRVNYRITGSWDEPAIERVIASTESESEGAS